MAEGGSYEGGCPRKKLSPHSRIMFSILLCIFKIDVYNAFIKQKNYILFKKNLATENI